MDNIAIIISVAAFATAVLGPLITAGIQCWHESRMHKMRYYDEHKQEVIENYLKSVGKYAFTTDRSEKRDFGESSAEIFMYTPKEMWPDIRRLNDLILEYTMSQGTYEQKHAEQTDIIKHYYALCEKFNNLSRK